MLKSINIPVVVVFVLMTASAVPLSTLKARVVYKNLRARENFTATIRQSDFDFLCAVGR